MVYIILNSLNLVCSLYTQNITQSSRRVILLRQNRNSPPARPQRALRVRRSHTVHCTHIAIEIDEKEAKVELSHSPAETRRSHIYASVTRPTMRVKKTNSRTGDGTASRESRFFVCFGIVWLTEWMDREKNPTIATITTWKWNTAITAVRCSVHISV